MKPKITLPLILFLFFTLVALAAAENVAFYKGIGAKSIGMGGAFRALADDNSAIFFNPAGLTQEKRYSIGAGYTLLRSNSTNANYFSGSVVDTKTSPMGAGLAYFYTQKFRDPTNPSTYLGQVQEVALALAQEYIRSFHLGFTTHYLWGDVQNGWRLDASALFIPSQYIIFSVIGKNLVEIKGDRREVDFGLASRVGDYVNLDFDFLWLPSAKTDNLGYNLGIELVGQKEFFIRGGYAFDRLHQDWYGLGAGWGFPRGTVNYGFRREVGGSDCLGHWVEITISM